MSKCFILLSIVLLSALIGNCSGQSNSTYSQLTALIEAQAAVVKNMSKQLEAQESEATVIKNNAKQMEAGYKVRIQLQDVLIKQITEQIKPELRKAVDSIDAVIKNWPDASSAISCLSYGNSTAIRTVKVNGSEPFNVSCDSHFAGPGWTVLLRRADFGRNNFSRDWKAYKNGFGELNGTFWLGLEKMHLLTNSQPHELAIYMDQGWENENDNEKYVRYARYDAFEIGNETELYEVKALGEFSGNAGDAFRAYQETSITNMKFSTHDRDNDKNANENCADSYGGGWWYNDCTSSSLTHSRDHRLKTGEDIPMTWGDTVPVFVQFMIRPKVT